MNIITDLVKAGANPSGQIVQKLADLGVFGGGISVDVPGFGKLDEEQLRNISKASEVAKKYGIPEMEFIRLLFHESGLRTDPGGNGGGIGQFLASTAAAYGYDQATLRNNVDVALDLAGRLLKENYQSLGGDDWRKAFAAYFVGPGNVAQAVGQAGTSGNWLSALDKIAAQYNQGTVSEYLNSIGMGDVAGSFPNSSSSSTQQTEFPSNTDLQPPNTKDFQIVDPRTGAVSFDSAGYYNAWAQYSQAKTLMDSHSGDQLSQYMDAVIGEIQAEIASGNLQVSKANALLNARVQSYQNVLDSYNGDAFKYSAPSNATYVPGRAPGDYAVRVLGLSPKLADKSNVVNPLQEAMKTVSGTQSDLNQIQIPSVPHLSSAITVNPGAITDLGPANTSAPPTTPPLAAEQSALQSALEQLMVQGVL